MVDSFATIETLQKGCHYKSDFHCGSCRHDLCVDGRTVMCRNPALVNPASRDGRDRDVCFW